MVGNQTIINMRKRGVKPSIVWIELLPMQSWVRQFAGKESGSATVIVEGKEQINPETLDLRFLSGISNVIVNGPDSDITEKVGELCSKAGAVVVQAFRYDVSKPYQIDVTRGTRFSQDGVKVVWPR